MNGRKAKARNRERAKAAAALADVDKDVGVLVAWCRGPEDLEDAKQQTHDGLIALMGDRRTGGVQWRICEGREQGEEALRVLRHGCTDQALLDLYRRHGAHLREWGGYLVVAMAEGVAPDPETKGKRVLRLAASNPHLGRFR